MSSRPITFLSDYGRADEFAGVCRAVIARIAPEATVIDLTHGIPPPRRASGRRGACELAARTRPPGVHLAVVDPGVGTDGGRWRFASAEDDRSSSAPTTACSRSALERFGGAAQAVDDRLAGCGWSRCPRPSTAATCSLRSPPGWPSATGLAELGEPSTPRRWRGSTAPSRRSSPAPLAATSAYVDRFGNLALDLDRRRPAAAPASAGEAVRVTRAADHDERRLALTFADGPTGA